MPAIPATIPYEQVFDLAVQLAGRTPDNVPVAEETMLQAFFAGELRDQWLKEAWPELCDNFSLVPLVAGAFSKNLGTPGEIGDILGVFTLDPRATGGWQKFPANRINEGNGQVRVATNLGQVWVEYQLPVPDLLDPSLIGAANEAALLAVTLPSRFRMPLAFRGAAHLLATEDPTLANKYLQMAETELQRQAAHPSLRQPYWRTEVRTDTSLCGLTNSSS